MPKGLKSTCRKFDVYLTSFLRYCKGITNLLFWELLECLTIPIKIIVSICNKLPYLSACKKSTSSLTYFFLTILQRNGKLVILVNLGMPCHTHLKWQYHFEKAFDVYHGTILGKKSTSPFTFSLWYCKLDVLGTLGMLG